GGACVLRLPREPRAELCGPLRRQGGGREGARIRRCPGVRVAGRGDRRAPEARGSAARPREGMGGAARGGGDRSLDDPFARARLRHLRRRRSLMLEPLFPADEVRGPEAAELIGRMNRSGVPVVAVDVPSGVDASTGEVAGVAVRAELTVTMHAPKVGLAVAPGRFHAGEIETVPIGLDHAETRHRLVTDEILQLVPRRRPDDNKYSAGAVLVAGGAPGLTGAACLAAEAAFRADAGYVAVAVPERSLPIVEQRLLEAVKRTMDEVDELLPRMSALALGPGLGRGEKERALVRRLLEESSLPIVVDADGLYELEPFQRAGATVLTPHSGELGRLIAKS